MWCVARVTCLVIIIIAIIIGIIFIRSMVSISWVGLQIVVRHPRLYLPLCIRRVHHAQPNTSYSCFLAAAHQQPKPQCGYQTKTECRLARNKTTLVRDNMIRINQTQPPICWPQHGHSCPGGDRVRVVLGREGHSSMGCRRSNASTDLFLLIAFVHGLSYIACMSRSRLRAR